MTCDPSQVITQAEIAGLNSDIMTIDDVVESSLDTTVTKNGKTVNTLLGKLKQLGYIPPVTYAGAIAFTTSDNTKTIDNGGVIYAPLPSALPFTTSGTWSADDETKFFVVQMQGLTLTSKSVPIIFNNTTDAIAMLTADGITIDVQIGQLYETIEFSSGTGIGGARYLGVAESGQPASNAYLRCANGNVLELQVGDKILGTQFGASTSSADNYLALKDALEYAKGGDVHLPTGVFTVLTNIDAGLTTGMGRLVGATYAYFTHFGNSGDVAGSTDYSYMGERCTVIKCDGCNLIGEPDTGTVNANAIGKLKGIKNLFVWGVNAGVNMGIYCIPRDISIEDSTIVDFGWYGYVQRNGITTKFDNVGFKNNGWNKAESGLFYDPAPTNQEDRYTYDSGCQIKFVSNETAGNFTKIEISSWGSAATRRPTTIGMSNVFMTASPAYLSSNSGMRGIQAGGCRSFDLDAVGGYFGNYFAVCSETVADCFHGETLTANGAVNGDATPITLQLTDCATMFNSPILGVFPPAQTNSGHTVVATWVNQISRNGRNISGVLESQVDSVLPIKNKFGGKIATSVLGGGISQLVWSDIVPSGFTGILLCNVTYASAKANIATAAFLITRNGTAVTSNQLHSFPVTGGYGFEVTAAQPNIADGDITIDITFGASWTGGGNFTTYISLAGMDSLI